MNRIWVSALALAGMVCATTAWAGSFNDAITGGKAKLDLRYRYEFVDQQGFDDNADASTLRGRLNWTSGDYNGVSGFVEFDTVATIILDQYNSGEGTSSAARSRYPVVADPDYTEVNQLYLEFGGLPDTAIRLGRQRIGLDNHRFVGNVGWRQNEQTYDAVSVAYRPKDGVNVFYAFVDNVNRIFGDDVNAGDHDSSTHLLNASYAFAGAGTLAAYYYGIDNMDAAAASTETIGVRFAGKAGLSGRPVRYLLEYARQSDVADNPVDFDADYVRVDGAIDLGPVTVSAAYELLSGDDRRRGAAFRTPMATLHAHNGWADQFLSTPDAGLTDVSVGASGKVDVWSWQALYHWYDSDAGSTDFGGELDLSLGRKFGDNYGLLFKAAAFRADSASYVDVTKLWIMLTASW